MSAANSPRRFLALFSALAAAWLLLATPAGATRFSFDYDEDSSPPFDPDGSKLKAIVTAAGQIWADYIDAFVVVNNQVVEATYSFDLRWEDLDGDALGQHQPEVPIFDSRDLVFDTKDSNGNFRNWFFDPTPFDNSEFAMNQFLIRDLDPQDVDDAYSGATSPFPTLEAGFSGPAISPDAIGKHDLLTVVLHEMGHMLGFNWNPNDGDYDFPSWAIGGHNLGVNEVHDMHGGVEQALMFHQLGTDLRRLPSTTDILALADEGLPMTFDVPRMEYIGVHSTDWQDTLNWIGGAVPDGDNQVFVRQGGAAVMSANGAAASLLVSEESEALVNNHQFRVSGDTTVGSNFGPAGKLHVGTLLPGSALFETNNLRLNSGIVNLQNNDAVVRVHNDMTIGPIGTLMGAGRTEIGGRLINNGHINAGTFLLFGFGGDLTLTTSGGGKLDLDGNTFTEGGRIAAVSGNLHVAGALSDDFDGAAIIGAGRTMSFDRAWNNHGSLEFRGGPSFDEAATLAGPGIMTFDGEMDVDGAGVIAAPLIVNPAAQIQVLDANDQITFAGATTIRGGQFSGGGSLAIAGRTRVHLPNPIVPENLPDTNTGTFRLFGGLGDVAAPPTGGVFEPGTSEFDGVTTTFPTTYSFALPVTVKIGGTLLAYGSSIHLPQTTTMAGGRLGGTHVVNQVGDLLVQQSSIINPTTFLWGVDALQHRTLLRAGARLDLTPRQISRAGTDNFYRGDITLEAGSRLHVDLGAATSWNLAGSLTMAPGSVVSGDDVVNTGDVSGSGSFLVNRLVNSGRIAPGRIFGGLQLPGADFVQTPDGLLEAVLGHSLIGNGSSLLTAKTAQLAGELVLSLASGFTPAVGAEFDILKATSIAGTFSRVSLISPLNAAFDGELLYRPDRVTFRVTAAGNTADFNDDGIVDGQDLSIWQSAISGKIDRTLRLAADATGDSRVDGADFLAWQRQFSARSGGKLPGINRLSVAAVPEPTAGAMALVATALLYVGGRKTKQASSL